MNRPNLITDISLDDQFDQQQIALLRSLRNGALLPQLLRVYRDQVIKQVEDLRAAIQRADHHAARIGAHTLKSASFSVGAKHMGALCTQIEACALQQSSENIAQLSIQLDACLAALLPAIDGYLSP